MKPIDIRNEKFQTIYARLTEDRLAVYDALLAAGMCTTRELAERMHRDVLSVRPRVTELMAMCAAELCGRRDGEGMYRARPYVEWQACFAREQTRATIGEQLTLGF